MVLDCFFFISCNIKFIRLCVPRDLFLSFHEMETALCSCVVGLWYMKFKIAQIVKTKRISDLLDFQQKLVQKDISNSWISLVCFQTPYLQIIRF